MMPPAKLATIARKNRAYAILVQLETQAQRLKNSRRVAPAELAQRIEQAKIEYQIACDKSA